MASDKGTFKEVLDDNLVQARDSILLENEEIIAQTMGDPGQAVVLTKGRVLTIKVGLTATGELGGQRTSAFLWDDITAVNVRKGPLGAVIQICTASKNTTPDCVIVFSGDAKVKKCEAIAAKIASAIGKQVEKIGQGLPKQKPMQPSDAEPEKIVQQPKNVVQETVAIDEIQPTKPDDVAGSNEIQKPDDIHDTKRTSRKKQKKQEDTVQKDKTKPEKKADDIKTDEKVTEKAPKRRGGREARSLAEEMFANVISANTAPSHSKQPKQKKEPEIEPTPVYEKNEEILEQPNIEIPAKAAVEPLPAVEQKAEIKAETAEPIIEENNKTEEPQLQTPVLESCIENSEMPDYDLAAEPENAEPEQQENNVLKDAAENISDDFKPNPRLPKPMKKKSGGPNKVLVLLGGLAVLMVLGMAIMSPMKQQEEPQQMTVNVDKLIHSAKVIRRQYRSVSTYRANIEKILKSNDSSTSALKHALMSGNKSSAMYLANNDNTNQVWNNMNKLKAPIGLAGAKEYLTSGLFMRETAIANFAASVHSSSNINLHETLNRLSESDKTINKGLAAVDNMLSDLKKDISKDSKTAGHNKNSKAH